MVHADEVAIAHLQRRKIEGRVLIPFIMEDAGCCDFRFRKRA